MSGLLDRTADLLAEWTGCDVRIDTAALTDAKEYGGEAYAVYATIGDVHVEDWFGVGLMNAFEDEGRGCYSVPLAKALLRRYALRTGGAVTADVVTVERDDDDDDGHRHMGDGE